MIESIHTSMYVVYMVYIIQIQYICVDDVTIQFARSSGAGGQNVNKVNTKVDMRLHLGNAGWLDSEIADAVRRMEKKRINKDDELVIMSQRTRSQLYVFFIFFSFLCTWWYIFLYVHTCV